MVVFTTTGGMVSIIHSDGKSLFERNGVEWARNAAQDTQSEIAYTETRMGVTTIRLTKEEMKRIIRGDTAMRTPTTVLEMRYYVTSLPGRMQKIADEWNDQRLRSILMEADDTGKNAGTLLERHIEKELERQEEQKRPPEAPPVAPEKPKKPTRYSSTPRPRKQEGSVSVALGEVSVLLTPKQLEFMERLSENPGWEGPEGEYVASSYAEELSDTMNAMSVGAVLTTLREKHLLTTEKSRMRGQKVCVFKLTDLGVEVYKWLAKR